jgi:hypothetical protein
MANVQHQTKHWEPDQGRRRMTDFITKLSRKYFLWEWLNLGSHTNHRRMFEAIVKEMRWSIHDEITDRLR